MILITYFTQVVLKRFLVIIACGGIHGRRSSGCRWLNYAILHPKDFSFNHKMHLSPYLLSDQTLKSILFIT